MKEVIIFDVMGVIFEVSDDTEDLLVPYLQARRPDTPRDFVVEKYLEASLGRITARELWTALGFGQDEINTIQEAYLDTYTIDREFIDCASQLKKRYILALLSNDISEWGQILRRKHGIDSLIDQAFISSDLGLRKPDPRIYQYVLEEMNVSSSACVFVDDYPERVKAAEDLGMTSILFNRQNHYYQGLQVRSFSQLTGLLI
ncbi:MAG: HAD-IA family hydrolase [Dehalococcoidales bacterium]|nr:HAD-IA family hydrolase [Dehalococcoidales bacterium]